MNANTGLTSQMYYFTLPFNLFYEKAMVILTDTFSYPLYSPDLIKNEIQAVNHEFYQRMTSEIVEVDIIRQLSNDQTPFNGMLCGNNETLIPSESEKLSKILKGYHMVIKNPNNIFFVLYSNKTIKESEEIAKEYLNYKMHIFPDNEIDIEDKTKLEQNMINIVDTEIFDVNLYKHGFYYNTYSKSNLLQIYYYIGNAEFQKLHFNIINNIEYLFNSESLMKIFETSNLELFLFGIFHFGISILELSLFGIFHFGTIPFWNFPFWYYWNIQYILIFIIHYNSYKIENSKVEISKME